MEKKIKAVVLATDFHEKIADVMIAAAENEIESAEGIVAEVRRVPGSYEVPLHVDSLLKKGCDILVVLGYIERGETLHGEVMGNVVHNSLISLSLKYNTPIGIGIIGPGATAEQAELRKESYARAAVKAAIRSFRELQKD